MVDRYLVSGERLQWIESLMAGSKVRCFIRTGKGGTGEIMTVHDCFWTNSCESGYGVRLQEYMPYGDIPVMVDSFWIELVNNNGEER